MRLVCSLATHFACEGKWKEVKDLPLWHRFLLCIKSAVLRRKCDPFPLKETTLPILVKERKKDDFDIATGVNCGATSFSSWSESVCNPETGNTIIRGPRRLLVSCRK